MSPQGTDTGAASYQKLVTLDSSESQPPTEAYIASDDALILQVWNSAAGITILLNVRLLLPDGTVVPNTFTFTPTSDRTLNQFSQQLAEGFILSICVMGGAAVQRGQTFARIGLIRGFGTVNFVGQVYGQGYIGDKINISWPYGLFDVNNSGRGAIRSITGSTPAAGAEFSVTVPTGAQWRLQSLIASLTTSAAVANRAPTLVIDDGVNVVMQSTVSAVQVASTTGALTWAEGFFRANFLGTTQGASLPFDMILLAGFRIRSVTGLLQAADQYTAPQMLVQEWISP